MRTKPFLDRPIYYSRFGSATEVFNDLQQVKSRREFSLDRKGLCQLMIFGGNFFPFSIFEDIVPFAGQSNKNSEYFTDIDTACSTILDSFFDAAKKIDVYTYLMFSGGLDSTIVMSLMRNKIKMAGCSLYRSDYEADVRNAIAYFPDIPLFCLDPDKKKYMEVIKNTEFYHAFINEGMVDDIIHCQHASDENIPLLLTGMGADEYLGDYAICKDHKQTPSLKVYLNKYSVFPQELIFNLFEESLIDEVYRRSMERFDFTTLKGRIEFVIEALHLSNQCALADNSVKNTGQERFSFFNTSFFKEISLRLTDNMIENNNVEKYILRRSFKGIIPDEVVYKRSKDFDADPELLYSESIYEEIRNKLICLKTFLNPDIEIVQNLSKRHKIRLYLLLRQLECFFLK